MTTQEQPLTFGQRWADRIARFGGSWTFIGIFLFLMLVWMAINVFELHPPFDPYPFILLNLMLSCLAALQAPVIMMSQNRQNEKDRINAEHDYQVNRKAEAEIQLLHEKLDRLLELHHLQHESVEELKVKVRSLSEP
jgi:uncharacterized membrane protein